MGKNLFSAITCAVVLGIVLFSSASHAEKVGYINLQRLVNESKMGKSARADLQKLREEKEASLNKKMEEINRMREDANKLDPEKKQGKLQDVKTAYKEYQRLVADAKEAIVNEDREIVSIILKKADTILKEVAKKNKYTIILKDPDAVGFIDPSVDITDLVLVELNK